ncbi:protein yippee-like At3g55890 [Miscanthus floridulus]|uniref:protein yippee-like At3g55890 n=1 Tax=Miscanthus floridulus TaxID=154761 RepID=UPI00345AD23E
MEAQAPEENAAAAAVDAVTQMTNRFSAINMDDADAGPLKLDDVDGNVYSCKHCRTHLAVADDIISKSFHCKNGKAYLFDKVINVTVGEKEDRMMITGMHSISDIFCVGCGEIVGWKYGAAYERSQKYKEGKIALDRYQLLGPE